MLSDGFRFTLSASLFSVWQILGSSNLSSWESLGIITNSLGQVQFRYPAASSDSRRFYKAIAQP